VANGKQWLGLGVQPVSIYAARRSPCAWAAEEALSGMLSLEPAPDDGSERTWVSAHIGTLRSLVVPCLVPHAGYMQPVSLRAGLKKPNRREAWRVTA
jgi:hypothetical protein